MSSPESMPLHEGQPGDDNIVFFGRPEPEQPPPIEEFEEQILRTFIGDKNTDFVLKEAREAGVDFRVILDRGISSYAELCEIYKQRLPIHYIGKDGKSHKIRNELEEDGPQAS